YLKQLCSEQLITSKNRRGYAVREWQKTRERNEALDCYVYARAAAAVEGLDRFSDRHWREMERSLGLDEPAKARLSEDNQPKPPTRKPVKRRARSKGVKL
ncbi:MAG: phage terminase large subunit family protein, partial [Alphaproteobacteria bacterium]|nr:phage terminase large subunit family protein [Alphaproteobacteria bacterium]